MVQEQAQTWDELRTVQQKIYRSVPVTEHERIRWLWRTGRMTQQQVAEVYGVSQTTIYKIVNGVTTDKEVVSRGSPCYLYAKRPMPMHLIADRAAAEERDRQRATEWTQPLVQWDEADE